MKIEDHMKNIEESLEEIEEAVEKGLTKRQRSLAFHVSVVSTELLEVYLHKLRLLDEGKVLKHNMFSSKRRANEELPFDFPHKKEIINLLVEIEKRRNILTYGKRRNEKELEEFLNLFLKLKKIFEEEGVI